MAHLRKLTADEVKFTFDWETDVEDPARYFDNKQEVRDIYKRLSNGDVAAWFVAIVRAKWGIFEGEATLSGCSYDDFDSLINDNYYYPELQADALADLNHNIAVEWRGIQKLVVDGEPEAVK